MINIDHVIFHHQGVSGLSSLDSPIGVVGDVTAPVSVVQEDPTMDMTSAALLAYDDPGVRATQVRLLQRLCSL